MAFGFSSNPESDSQLAESRKPERRGPLAEAPGFDLFLVIYLPSVSWSAMCCPSSASQCTEAPPPYHCVSASQVPLRSGVPPRSFSLPSTSLSSSTEESLSPTVPDIKKEVNTQNGMEFSSWLFKRRLSSPDSYIVRQWNFSLISLIFS